MSYAQDASNVSKSFLSVAHKIDKHRGSLDDTNAFFSCNGYGVRQNPSYHIYNWLIYVCSFRDGPGE